MTPRKQCGRTYTHPPHLYVTHPNSVVDHHCPGRRRARGTRPVWQLAVEQPQVLDVGVGGLIHTLAVSAA